MTERTELRSNLINCSEAQCLALFKKKVNELSEIARNMPKEYIQEARNYFFQHCESLRDSFSIKQEFRISQESSSPGIRNALLDNTGEILMEKKGNNLRTKGEVNIFQTCIQTKDIGVKVEENECTCSKSLQCFDSSESAAKSIIQEEEFSAQGEVTRKAAEMSTKRPLKLITKATRDEISQTTEAVKEETVKSSECAEELVTTKVNREKGQASVCDIEKLLECIPELSQYMQVDPRNVTVLKDSEEDDEHFLHLSVELDDGTVQEFKIASYIHDTDNETEGYISTDSKILSEEGLASRAFPKSKQNYTVLNETVKDGPSVMGRRLRTRKKKPEVKHRGPGRPKNENIPTPEINGKGEAFYRCKECEATVKTYNALIVHMRTHTGSRPFHCSVCSKSFTTKGNMKAHELTTHSDSKPWKCKYCDKCFKEKKVLKIHERIHTGEKPYSCSVCERCFSQKSVMLEHMLVHSDDKPHLCDFCGQGFRGASSLKAHKKRHLGLREFQCDSCDKAFVCRNELKRHLLTHTGERPYSCEVCSKAFTRLSYLKEHVNLHTGLKPFTCFECGISFSDTMSLHRHKRRHKTESESTSAENKPVTVMNTSSDNIPTADTDRNLTLEIPEEMTVNGGSIQLVVDENTSVEDFQKLHSLLLSATENGELMMNSQDTSKQLYQVLCVNPDTQEVVGHVEGQEVIVEGHSEDIASMDLQYSVH